MTGQMASLAYEKPGLKQTTQALPWSVRKFRQSEMCTLFTRLDVKRFSLEKFIELS